MLRRHPIMSMLLVVWLWSLAIGLGLLSLAQ